MNKKKNSLKNVLSVRLLQLQDRDFKIFFCSDIWVINLMMQRQLLLVDYSLYVDHLLLNSNHSLFVVNLIQINFSCNVGDWAVLFSF